MAEMKRKFYGTGEAKGFTKASFYQAVRDIVNGDEVSEKLTKLVGEAAEYELDGIASKALNRPVADKKDPLDSTYAKAVEAAILPLVNSTPQTTQQLIEQATAKGQLSPKGTPFAPVWVSRVLYAKKSIAVVKVIVEKTNKSGLKSQTEATAYKLA